MTLIFIFAIAVPAQWTKDGTFHHTMEGEDDMPGHVKSSLMGPSLNIPVRLFDFLPLCFIIFSMFTILNYFSTLCESIQWSSICHLHFLWSRQSSCQIRNGRLALGTWQGIYLNEHRDQGGWGGGHTRNIVITIQGQS